MLLFSMRNTHTQVIKRVLEKAGFVFLRGGWVRKESARRLQSQIDKAVTEAAPDVEAIRDGIDN